MTRYKIRITVEDIAFTYTIHSDIILPHCGIYIAVACHSTMCFPRDIEQRVKLVFSWMFWSFGASLHSRSAMGTPCCPSLTNLEQLTLEQLAHLERIPEDFLIEHPLNCSPKLQWFHLTLYLRLLYLRIIHRGNWHSTMNSKWFLFMICIYEIAA